MSKSTEYAEVLGVIRRYPAGASLEEIRQGLANPPPARTLSRWLADLAANERIRVDGYARASRYVALEPIVPVQVAQSAPPTSSTATAKTTRDQPPLPSASSSATVRTAAPAAPILPITPTAPAALRPAASPPPSKLAGPSASDRIAVAPMPSVARPTFSAAPVAPPTDPNLFDWAYHPRDLEPGMDPMTYLFHRIAEERLLYKGACITAREVANLYLRTADRAPFLTLAYPALAKKYGVQ